jgi:hypothetical protein
MTHTPWVEKLYQEELYRINPKTLVIITKTWSDLSEVEYNLLEKIIKSLQLSLASIQVVVRSQFSVDDFQAFAPPFIIAFGAALRNSDKMYEEIRVNGTKVVVAHELGQLDETRKRNLWITLKQVFHS